MESQFLLAALGSLSSLLVAVLCFFLKGIYEEMKSMNAQLIKVVSNQEWHYNKIVDLESRVRVLEKKEFSLET